MLCSLSRRYVGQDYGTKKPVGEITADMIDMVRGKIAWKWLQAWNASGSSLNLDCFSSISSSHNLHFDYSATVVLSVCFLGSRDSLLVECWTRDQKIVSLNPGRSSGRIFFSRVNFLCWLLVDVFSILCYHMPHKRPLSFCQKCRWQVTPKHIYTLDPCCPGIVWSLSGKQAQMQLVREHSATAVSAHWATVDWSWP